MWMWQWLYGVEEERGMAGGSGATGSLLVEGGGRREEGERVYM